MMTRAQGHLDHVLKEMAFLQYWMVKGLQIEVLTRAQGHLDHVLKMHLHSFPVGYLEKMIERYLLFCGVAEGILYCRNHAGVCILYKWFCVLPSSYPELDILCRPTSDQASSWSVA